MGAVYTLVMACQVVVGLAAVAGILVVVKAGRYHHLAWLLPLLALQIPVQPPPYSGWPMAIWMHSHGILPVVMFIGLLRVVSDQKPDTILSAANAEPDDTSAWPPPPSRSNPG